MSTTSVSREWLIQVPVAPASTEKRLAIRQQHLDEAAPKIKQGIISFAGGTLSEPTSDGDNKNMIVTLFTVSVQTEEMARKILEEDVYTREGIWNSKEAKIFPWKTGIRTSM